MKKLVTMFLIAAMVTTSVGLNHVNVTAEEQVETSVEDTTEENAADGQAEEASPETEENSGTDTQKAIEESAEQQETAQQETAQEENPEEGDHANSFRYSDGEVLGSVRSKRSIATQSSITQENITRKGIDVSEHNGDINWDKVKAAGIDFVILRCGYGQDQTSQDDKKWLRNVEACERLGIPYGVYIYSYATNTTKASSEADHVLRLIQGHKLSYPVYFDMEDTSTENSDLTAIAKTFCNKIQNAGYPVGVYASLSWWNSKLTDTCFGNWYRWIASWSASKCNYNGDFALWQYSENGAVSGISGNVDMNYLMGSPSNHGDPIEVMPDEVKNALSYEAHVSDIGWQGSVAGGSTAGTVGKNRGIEAIKVSSQIENVQVRYSSYTPKTGWQNYVTDGEISGSTGNNRSLEAVKMELAGSEKDNYDIYYRVHVSDYGWLDWTKDGSEAGTIGYGKKIEGIQIRILEKDSEYIPETGTNASKIKPFGVGYQAKVQNSGWQSEVENGATAGTVGKNKAVEAIKMELQNQDVSGNIDYHVYVSGKGWKDYVEEGTSTGITGSDQQIESIGVKLTGEMAEKYDVYYRVHSADIGWLGWAKDGENAGSIGYGKQIEAYEVQLLAKGSTPAGYGETAFKEKKNSITYQAHVADIGWQKYVSDGKTAGTTGKGKQIEAMRIEIEDKEYTGSVEYRAHVADIGWQKYVSEGNLAGTTGKNKQIEAVSIRLTGEMAEKYDIYYRVHSADFGWLGWTKNGKNAGSEGYGKRIEAIQIQLVEKGNTFSGNTKNSFYVK